MSTSGEILVMLCGIVAIVAAVGTVALRTPLRAAMCLLAHIVSLAGLYLTLNAHLLAAIQLLVYAGAVVVLFVFVIMLIGPSAEGARPDQRGMVVKTVGGALLAMTFGTVAFAVGAAGNEVERPSIVACEDGTAECQQFGGVDAVSDALYVGAAIPFELASLLLLVAILAAIAVARGNDNTGKKAIDPASLPIRPKMISASGHTLPEGVDGDDETSSDDDDRGDAARAAE